MPIEVDANNPIGITIAGPGYGNPNGSPTYGAQGVITSGAGFTFDKFATPQQGIQGAIAYITKQINNGVNSVSALISKFGPNDLQPFLKVTGLQPNSPLTASQAPLYAAGIAAGEGTLQAFGGVAAFTGQATDAATAVVGNNASASAGAPATTQANLFSQLSDLFSINTAQRTTAVVGGVILAIVAVTVLIISSKPVQEVVQTTAKAAVAA